VPNIKTAENMNLGPFMTTSAALNARSLLHAPHQPPDMMLVKLIMPPVRWRQPEATKPVAAIVMQVMGHFPSQKFQNLMFHNIVCVSHA
jgi:hypothetical protein